MEVSLNGSFKFIKIVCFAYCHDGYDEAEKNADHHFLLNILLYVLKSKNTSKR